MSDTVAPEELAKQLWFPRWFDDPSITEVSAIGIDIYQAYPADKRGEMIETVRKNRLAIKEQGRQAFVATASGSCAARRIRTRC